MTPVFGLPKVALWCAIAAGAVVGAAYTLSATTVLFLLAMPLLFAWAGQGLGPRERRWVLGVLGVAVVARMATLAGFFLFADHVNIPYAVLLGDEYVIEWRSLMLLKLTLGHTIAPTDYFYMLPNGDTHTGLIYLFTYWQLLFGPSPYGIHLLSVAMWLTGATALHRTARRAFGPLAALGGFVLVLFLPTLFVWSISTLKEPTYFFLTAVTIAAAWTFVRRRGVSRRVIAAIVATLAIAAIASLRSIGLVVTAGGLVAALGGWLLTRRAWIGAAAAVLTAVVIAAAVEGVIGQTVVEQRLMPALRQAAKGHLGNVRTAGYSYKLLDTRFYMDYRADPVAQMTRPEAARFVERAAASFIFVPLPWDLVSTSAIALLPEQIAWYILVGLALVGLAAGWQRDPTLTWLLVGNILVGAAVVSLFNGNVGTFVRLRDSVVVMIVWLSALGGCLVLESAARYFWGGTLHAHSR